jgi:hypothetical protein
MATGAALVVVPVWPTVGILLAPTVVAGRTIVLKASGAGQVYVGPAGVTPETGFPVPGGVPFVIPGATGELFGTVAEGGRPVGVNVLQFDAPA